ncbi:DNA-directed RNA polymerase II subunit [Trichinella pseudospiralis]
MMLCCRTVKAHTFDHLIRPFDHLKIFRFLRCAPSSKVFCLLHAERLLSGLSFRASPFTDSTSQLFLNRFPSSGHEVMLLHGRCILLQVLSTPILSPAHFQG